MNDIPLSGTSALKSIHLDGNSGNGRRWYSQTNSPDHPSMWIDTTLARAILRTIVPPNRSTLTLHNGERE